MPMPTVWFNEESGSAPFEVEYQQRIRTRLAGQLDHALPRLSLRNTWTLVWKTQLQLVSSGKLMTHAQVAELV